MSPALRKGSAILVVEATVRGLVSEADRVRELVARVSPAAIAIGMSPEGVADMEQFEGEPTGEIPDGLPEHDVKFGDLLARFGPVALPPPDILAAVRFARERAIPIHGVDLTEPAYEEAFTTEVSTFAFLRYGRIQRKLVKKPPRADDPRALSLEWDARIRRVQGIARVEARRERATAHGAAALAARTSGPVLLLVEVAREAGILAALESDGFMPETSAGRGQR